MALQGKIIATGRGMDTPTLPISNPNGLFFRNGDAAVAVTTVVTTADGENVTVNNLPAGGVIDWVKIIAVVSTSATDYEVYLWK